MEAKVLSEAKVYVGTYAKYNNGSLSGAWLDLSDYSDKEEFYEACRELHKDEEDAEYMFQDWENVPEGLIDESWISENFFALRDAVEDLSDTEQEAFFVWCNYKSHDLGEEDADDLVRDFRDEYLGQYDDEEDFAYEIVEECYKHTDRIVISTSGWFEDRVIALAKQFPIIGIRISIEGLSCKTTNYGGHAGGFDKGLRTLLALKEMGLKDIGFGCTVSNNNSKDMLSLYQLSKSLGMEFATAAFHNSYYFIRTTMSSPTRTRCAVTLSN